MMQEFKVHHLYNSGGEPVRASISYSYFYYLMLDVEKEFTLIMKYEHGDQS